MAIPGFVKLDRLSLRSHPVLDERWVQSRIAEDPGLLGLGDLVLKDKERMQPRAGRLDLLLQDPESSRRYEVEIQLGASDETHIIRTLEYWDIERKRYPQYEHCAVLVAEDITSRFLNVIGLFNGTIPLVAIQMQAFQANGGVALVFTTVMDELTRGAIDEDENAQAVTDRSYWENHGGRATLPLVDQLLNIVREIDPTLGLKYNKFYIGLATDGQPNNFIVMRPRKSTLLLTVRVPSSTDVQSMLDASGIETVDYDKREGGYRIRIVEEDLIKRADILRELIRQAYDAQTN
jgi:hypothetical protein